MKLVTFFQFYIFSFFPIDGVVSLIEPFSFMRFLVLIVVPSACTISVLFRKLSPMQMHSSLFPTFSYQVLSIWFYIEIFDLLGLEFYAG